MAPVCDTSQPAQPEVHEPERANIEPTVPSSPQPLPIRMFSEQKHLFIELHEFRGASWHETHRWNYGLQEDLIQSVDPVRQTSCMSWTQPHLPSGSLLGMMSLREAMAPELVLLDPPDESTDALEQLANTLLTCLSATGRLAEDKRETARSMMVQHLNRKESAVVARYVPQSQLLESEETDFEPLGEDDPLKPEENEETAHILVDTVEWLEQDIVSFVRLSRAADTGLEEQKSRSKARFIVVVLGPGTKSDPHRQIHMGEAAAALLQNDYVVQAAYGAQRPEDFLLILEDCFRGMRLVPQTTHPTVKGVRHHAEVMLRQMVEMKTRRKKLRSQKFRWKERQQFHFPRKLSIRRFLTLMQQLALPLLLGIAFGLVWVNVDPHSYDHWAGHGHTAHSEEPSAVDERPSFFDLSVKGHSVTLHFLVNDVFMCLFFGLAAKEITEAFQPGGSLYPPARSTLNVLSATVGGVAGPTLAYLALVAGASALGVLDERYDVAEYNIGWGIPTATDIAIAWMTAVCCFGQGHPAIDFLLLLAVIDDGIGLLIIAVAYPDPARPVQPVWLLLVVAAAGLSLLLRTLRCGRWQVYILLGGPVSWLGLLYAGLHPSLALVAVVPFMPLHSRADPLQTLSCMGVEDPNDDRLLRLVIDGEGDRHGRATLHDFEEATKPLVDFLVLFFFGVVNAGVRVGSSGVLTGIVLGALVLGKTLGISLASFAAGCLGFPPPPGIGKGAIIMVGFIASAGLTVALFVAGEAFKDYPMLADQAKLGALLSVLVALVGIGGSLVLGRQHRGAAEEEEEGLTWQKGDFNESLEEIVVKNTVESLQMIHRAEKAVEETQADWGLATR